MINSVASTPVKNVLRPINNVQFLGHKSSVGNHSHEEYQTEPNGISKTQVSGIAIATALAAATITGVVVHRNCEHGNKVLIDSIKKGYKDSINSYKNAIEEAYSQVNPLREENSSLQEKVKNLTTDKETLEKVNKALKESIQKTKDKFVEVFEGDLAPKDLREKILKTLEEKINKADYGYDITKPPVTGIGGNKVYDDAIPLPSHVGTNNRAASSDLHIPKIAENGEFNFEIPMSEEVKITNMTSNDFKPTSAVTNISESYADSVRWNNDKIARDLMQNFYDGHGQTLDGVKLMFTPQGNGKYKVRIEGKSTYTPDKAIYIGESTKRDNARAAGNYGEGLKMSVLKLLKDGGAQDVKIASDNWNLVYKLQEGNLSDKRVLAYSLNKAEKFNGNMVEFETPDKGLLESLRNTINRFYHSNNPDFRCPDFENDVLGVKILPQGQKGGIYIAGQRFEFNGSYDGPDGVSLFLKEKPDADVLDISRDRVSLNETNLCSIGGSLALNINISLEDKAKLLKSLERFWDHKNFSSETPMDRFVDGFGNCLKYASKKHHIKFPEKYVAYSDATDDVVRDLRMKGYKVCRSYFSELGMPTIRDVIGDARKHDVVVPNDVQKKKILILKEAIKKLSPSLEKTHFKPEELDTKIYMFDKTGAKDRKLYSNCDAEAIVDNGVSKGFWIEKSYLDNASFHDALETALHELSHKAGGDGSATFSYKLTDVNSSAIGQLIDDVQSRNEFQALAALWKSL